MIQKQPLIKEIVRVEMPIQYEDFKFAAPQRKTLQTRAWLN